MKAKLEFNLPEEQEELSEALNAIAFKGAIQQFDNYLRGELKHNDKLTDKERKILQKARDRLYDECVSVNIDIWV